ncbi:MULTISPECIES: nucleotidyl transferase AbiEii/AbiGii toxin family protein [unclassified Streptomyces]|uniref:nucleotidyl transferase AbiEii/AbiGii toxin family protein n=1 Tax=unclassified Streptomyces TaxID=2593676 RepID=UPI002DDAD1F3|nr:nucleotidyl transferase AbiEii/AbiGii toxin family protein [Streptomyces sp. NBC_00243]WRZ20323.1 nucleotidyl transferase AbiEii/AbiGii toxin family protein [Streptomyces sp. NBC_00243]
MKLPDLHRRLLKDALNVGSAYELALAGGYAVQAHGLVSRPSQDLDFATQHPASMADIVATLAGGLRGKGWSVAVVDTRPLKARLLVTDPHSREACEVDLLKEALSRRPVSMDVGQVVDLEDLVSMKVRALGDRGLPRDVIDVRAACEYYSVLELERLGLREEAEFNLGELRDRLESVVWVSDEEFAAYGLGSEEIAELRHWAQDWESDLGLRLAEEYDDPDDTPGGL